MYGDWILTCCLMYVGFVGCEPWRQDDWDEDISLLIKAHDLAIEYDEQQAATFGGVYETTDISDSKVAKKARWERVPEGEASYTALIYGYAEESKDKGAFGSYHLPLLGYCGAVLITTDTLLTLCPCVSSWLTWMKTTDGKGEMKVNYSSVLTDYDIPVKDIYVWNGENTFRPWTQDWRIKLTNDPEKQIMNNDWCFEALDNCNIRDHICQRANPAVLKFDLPYAYSAETLVPWPPAPFYYTEDNVAPPSNYGTYVRAYHYSYRFLSVDSFDGELYDEFGEWLDLGLLLVAVNKTLEDKRKCEPFDSCLAKSKCRSVDRWKLKQGITCFIGDKNPDICGGSYGSPVYGPSYGIHGLAMTMYPCGKVTNKHDASSILEVMAITPRMAEYIETLIPGLLDSSKELMPQEHLHRDISDYRMYDMVTYKFEIIDEKADALSEAVAVEPFWTLTALFFVFL